MALNIKIHYEVCKVVDNKSEVIEVVASSPLEALWAAYRLCVNLQAYSTYEEWEQEFDLDKAVTRIDNLRKIKWIKSKSGTPIYASSFLNQ